jgi:hypothetical protein
MLCSTVQWHSHETEWRHVLRDIPVPGALEMLRCRFASSLRQLTAVSAELTPCAQRRHLGGLQVLSPAPAPVLSASHFPHANYGVPHRTGPATCKAVQQAAHDCGEKCCCTSFVMYCRRFCSSLSFASMTHSSNLFCSRGSSCSIADAALQSCVHKKGKIQRSVVVAAGNHRLRKVL